MMFQSQRLSTRVRVSGVAALLTISTLAAACGNGNAAANGPPAGGGMAMGVEAVTLTPKPVERSTEYVATV